METASLRSVALPAALALLFSCGQSSFEVEREPEDVLAAEQSEQSRPAPGQLLVKFRAGTDTRVIDTVLGRYSASVEGHIPELGVLTLNVSGKKAAREVARLFKGEGSVEIAEENAIAELTSVTVNDPEFAQQWALGAARVPEAWSTTMGSPSVVVAIIDTGIDFTHPELTGQSLWTNAKDPRGDIPDACDRVQNPYLSPNDDDCNGYPDDYRGWDFAWSSMSIPGDNDPTDEWGHGTFSAGVVAARTNNAFGVASVAPKVTLMPVKACIKGDCKVDYVARAIVYAAKNGAKVVTFGLAFHQPSQVLQDAVNFAHSRGVLVVAAAGNFGHDSDPSVSAVGWPAALNHVVAVGATTVHDAAAFYTSGGPEVDLTAPGGDTEAWILGLHCLNGLDQATGKTGTGYFRYGGGTSASAPYVAAAAALVLSVNPSLSPDEVEAILKETAVDLGAPGPDRLFGAGRVDVAAAVARAKPPPACPGDSDCDGWTDAREGYLGTDPFSACNVAAVGPKQKSAWPPDLNDDNLVTVFDASFFSSSLNSRAGDSSFSSRLDLNGDGRINTLDVAFIGKQLNAACRR